jgi:hypothetical protein
VNLGPGQYDNELFGLYSYSRVKGSRIVENGNTGVKFWARSNTIRLSCLGCTRTIEWKALM